MCWLPGTYAEECRNGDRDGYDVYKRCRACGAQNEQYLLTGIGNRRQRVGRKNRKRQNLRQKRLFQILRGLGRPDDETLKRCLALHVLGSAAGRAPS